ncbi:MAG: hypothetical protein IPL25_19280 [Saprospiraceae bacterium]|nr:hypothetical protein [Candidatus Vicinibacter affinis]
MIVGNDTLNCLFSHWKQDGGITNKLEFLLAFEKGHITQTKKVVFHHQSSINEEVSFHLDSTDLINIPTIKLQ